MDRALRTVLASLACATLLLAALSPGRPRARLGVGLGTALLCLGCGWLGKLGLEALLREGWLQLATALAFVTIAAMLELPSRWMSSRLDLPVERSRGLVAVTVFVTCFVAAWVAGPDPHRDSAIEAAEARAAAARPEDGEGNARRAR